MSLGRQFIQAVIRDSTPALLAQTPALLFLEEELPLRAFVLRHYNMHRALPDAGVLRTGGFSFPELRVSQPVSYFMERLRQRFTYNAIMERTPGLTQAMSSQDSEGAVTALREMLSAVGAVTSNNNASLLGDEMRGVLDEFEVARTTYGLRGMTMGWPTLNRETLGAMGGDLIVIAGRPGSGKTYALIEMAYQGWLESHRAVLLSMEMGKRQLATRFLARHTGINPRFIRAGQLSPWAREMMETGAAALQAGSGRLYLESGDFSRSVSGIEAMIMQYEPEVVFVDAAYLLSVDGKRQGYVSKWESLSEVIAELKRLAIRYNIPVIITVQFNRNQKTRSKGEPDLSDIAGTDSIPQDASIVLGIQRPPAPYENTRRVMTMMKNREGELAKFLYRYEFSPVSFEELPWEELTEEAPAAEEEQEMLWME